MVEENKSPVFKLIKSIGIDGNVDVIFPESEEVASGISEQFNKEWNLYPIEVTNVTVFDGKQKLDNYSGEAVMFASDKQKKEINKLLDGKDGTKVRIHRKVEDGKRGPFNIISYELIEKGTEPDKKEKKLSTGNEDLFKTDYKELVESGDIEQLSEEEFIDTATSDPYKLSTLRAKKLFKELNK